MPEERRSSWHRKTCQTCLYRSCESCRRFPPVGINGNEAYYPIVRRNYVVGSEPENAEFLMACAEHLDVEERNKQNG